VLNKTDIESGPRDTGLGKNVNRIDNEETQMKKLSLHEQINDMEEVVRGFMRRPFALDAATPEMRLDVHEDDDSYSIHAEIPGAKKDDVKIELDDNYVSISAQKQSQIDRQNGGRWICSERNFGAVSRSMSLAHDIEPKKARAAYENGVLALTLPKKARSELHNIEIK
jgi:HSP20 family protein